MASVVAERFNAASFRSWRGGRIVAEQHTTGQTNTDDLSDPAVCETASRITIFRHGHAEKRTA
jgi:hypothetical protein